MVAIAAFASFAPSAFLPLGGILGLAVLATGDYRRVVRDRANWVSLAFTVWSALSIIWSVDRSLSSRMALTAFILAIVFAGVREVVRDAAALRKIAAGFIFGCVILFGRITGQAIIDIRSQPGIRFNLPDVNANYAGYSFAAAIGVLALLWFIRTPARWWPWVIGASLIIALAGIAVSDTRGSFLAVAALVVWSVLARFMKNPPIRTLIGVLVVIALCIATGVADKLSLVAESLLGRPTGDWSGRLMIWPLARQWWLEHFIVGSGTTTFQVSNQFDSAAHNFVLELGTGLGIVGVALFVSFLWIALRGPGRVTRVLIGVFLLANAFSYLSGVWELAPAAWVGISLFSLAGMSQKAVSVSVTPEKAASLTARPS